MEQLADNQTKLSDGRIVEVREAKGNDEMIIAAQLGDVCSANAGGYIIFQTCMTARCVVKIGDQTPPQFKKYADYRDFMGQFKKKDWDRIEKLYSKVNADDEEGNDESEGK